LAHFLDEKQKYLTFIQSKKISLSYSISLTDTMVAVERVDRWLQNVERYQRKLTNLTRERQKLVDWSVLKLVSSGSLEKMSTPEPRRRSRSLAAKPKGRRRLHIRRVDEEKDNLAIDPRYPLIEVVKEEREHEHEHYEPKKREARQPSPSNHEDELAAILGQLKMQENKGKRHTEDELVAILGQLKMQEQRGREKQSKRGYRHSRSFGQKRDDESMVLYQADTWVVYHEENDFDVQSGGGMLPMFRCGCTALD
jgi:hypothetical protein